MVRLEAKEENIGRTFLVKNITYFSTIIQQVTVLGFSDSKEFVKFANDKGETYWERTEDFEVLDSVSEIIERR